MTSISRLFIAAFLACSLFAGSAGAAGDSIPQMAWNPGVHGALEGWLGSLEGRRPETLVALADCDNTIWAGDVADAVMEIAVRDGIVTWKDAPVLPGFPFDREKGTPFDYFNRIHGIAAPVAFNYAAQIFSGLSLAEITRAFGAASRDPRFPKVHAEMKALVRTLIDRGYTVGFVSASPFFIVAQMVEHEGLGVPLWAIEGVDSYVVDPGKRGEPVMLSNLAQREGLRSWSDVVKRHGSMVVTPRVSELISAREGKATGGASIAWRQAMRWNRAHGASEKIAAGQMRLIGVFGDNYAPFSDLPGAEPEEMGNDQGLLRALPFADGGIVLNIYRAAGKGGALDLEKRKGNNDRFLALQKQVQALLGDVKFLDQMAVAEGEGLGFRPDDIPRAGRPGE